MCYFPSSEVATPVGACDAMAPEDGVPEDGAKAGPSPRRSFLLKLGAGAAALVVSPILVPAAPADAASVAYNGKTVSDAALRTKLQQIANFFNRTVSITSGDRTYVPPGGSRTSLHLAKRAADFHVLGISDETTARQIKASGLIKTDYELIWHTAQTNTGGPHVHLGRYGDNRASTFRKESRGVYTAL